MKKILIIFSFLLIFVSFSINFLIFPLKYTKNIKINSNLYNLQPELVCSIILAESGFRKNSVSSKGAIGLMQLMPSTAKWIYNIIYEDEFDVSKLKDEKINIKLGCYYLNYLNNKFDNLVYVLCAYNAGETTVRNWITEFSLNNTQLTTNNIPYKETRNYVNKILNYIKVYSIKLNQ